MRSLRRFGAVSATILALAMLVPSVSAAPHKHFALTKTCESTVLCTVTWSNFKPFTPGTDVTYTVNGDGSDGFAYPTIMVKGGSTTGVCDWNHPHGNVLAVCTFKTGTGTLRGFHLKVDVSVVGDPSSADSIWHWDGTYWFSHRKGHGHR